jgi:hypothetical protein
MKQSQKLAVTVVYITSLTAALAEPQASDLYAQAKDAYKKGNCNLSIELLTKYKIENESKLKENEEFSKQINNALNDAINACNGNRIILKTETDPGRITYKPAEAIDITAAKIQAAIDGISHGASGEEAAALIKQASDMSKEINANDKVDNARAKANRKLKAAMSHAQESSLQEAEKELRDAKKDFEALKSAL